MAKNSGIFYQEIRSNSKTVSDLAKKDEAVLSSISDAVQTLVWLAEQAIKEGLLWLDEAVQEERVSKLLLSYELKRMIDLIVDGTDPELVEDISMKRWVGGFFVSGISGWGAEYSVLYKSPCVQRKRIILYAGSGWR